jgi:hypothetical protein
LVVVALITAGFLAYRRRKQDSNTGHPVQLADDKCAELIEESPFEKVHHSVAELPSQESFVELPVFPEASNKPRGYESGSIAEMYVARIPHAEIFLEIVFIFRDLDILDKCSNYDPAFAFSLFR